MLKIFKTDDCENIKLSSEYFQDVIANPSDYQKLVISGSINNCTTQYTQDFELENPVLVGACNGVLSWVFDLKYILDNQLALTELNVKSVYTGTTLNILSTPFTFDNTCYTGAGNVIDACPDVATLITLIDTWFTTTMAYASIAVNVVDNKLYICSLPANIIPTTIKYSNGTIEDTSEFKLFDNDYFFINDGYIYVKPTFFENTDTTLTDGVYKIKVKIILDDGSYIEQETCAFIDCATKCLVASKIEGLIENDTTSNNIHIAYYGLLNGSNCGCNCTELFELYKYISEQLDTVDNECTTC